MREHVRMPAALLLRISAAADVLGLSSNEVVRRCLARAARKSFVVNPCETDLTTSTPIAYSGLPEGLSAEYIRQAVAFALDDTDVARRPPRLYLDPYRGPYYEQDRHVNTYAEFCQDVINATKRVNTGKDTGQVLKRRIRVSPVKKTALKKEGRT